MPPSYIVSGNELFLVSSVFSSINFFTLCDEMGGHHDTKSHLQDRKCEKFPKNIKILFDWSIFFLPRTISCKTLNSQKLQLFKIS
jgi:hypothetical protein